MKYIVIVAALFYICCTGGGVDAACQDMSSCTAKLGEMPSVDKPTMPTDAVLNNVCPKVSSFKSCVDGVLCSSKEAQFIPYKFTVGVGDGLAYICTTDVRSVMRKNEVCLKSLNATNLMASCGEIKPDCAAVNSLMKCSYDFVKKQCNAEVADIVSWTTVHMSRPVVDAVMDSCKIDTSYLSSSGKKTTSANQLTLFGIVCLSLIGLFHY